MVIIKYNYYVIFVITPNNTLDDVLLTTIIRYWVFEVTHFGNILSHCLNIECTGI